MTDVPDHLVPADGLTNSNIALEGIDLVGGGAINARFAITDENRDYVGTFTINVHPTGDGGTTDQMIAEAYRRMTDVLRQWLHGVDALRKVYEARQAP
jgi:hypothetical protein